MDENRGIAALAPVSVSQPRTPDYTVNGIRAEYRYGSSETSTEKTPMGETFG